MSRKYNSLVQQINNSNAVIYRSRGIVSDIILGEEGDDFRNVGVILVRDLKTDTSTSGDNLVKCLPKTYNDADIPLIDEIVEIVKTSNGSSYYERVFAPDLNKGNTIEGIGDVYVSEIERSSGNKTKDYKNVSQTNISKSSTNPKETKKQNKVFSETQVDKLRLYEGDRLLESRFGQSLRFSGYNNTEGEFSPTIILRNGQGLDKPEGTIIEEDINRDGSIIVLSSNKYKMDFQPGRVDDKGNSDWKLNTLYTTLPQEYTGFDQMLLNSERIIISSKSQEMLFFSKGNFSIVSDGELTADISKGGKFDFGDEVWITTDKDDKNIWVNTGLGEVRLNTDSQGNSPSKTGKPDQFGNPTLRKEPLVRGEVLFDLMNELIDEMLNMVYATPSGPTAEGPLPTHKEKLRDIKNRLKDFKSTTNFTE